MNPFLARFDGMPSLIAPERRARVEACLAAVAARGDRDALIGATANDQDFWPKPGSAAAGLRPYMVQAGILQIPVKGVLLADCPFALGSYATGYLYIRRALERGLADDAVKGIALVCGSPGGEVAENFDLSDAIFAARSRKPVRAIVEAAFSAAYSLASAADRIVLSRSGEVGSIGVITAHRDLSGAAAQAGIKVTLIFAGEHKADGNPFEPLPAAVRERVQHRIEGIYAEFAAIVARNRGLTDTAVRATKALTYGAADAVKIGLADEIASPETALATFAAAPRPASRLPSPSPPPKPAVPTPVAPPAAHVPENRPAMAAPKPAPPAPDPTAGLTAALDQLISMMELGATLLPVAHPPQAASSPVPAAAQVPAGAGLSRAVDDLIAGMVGGSRSAGFAPR